jgi:TPR repeat protein
MRHFRLAFFLVMALACATIASAASLEDAEFAYERGDYTQAARLFRPFAEQGAPSAQFSLGMMYAKGQGVPQDYQAALKWFHKAAEQGDAAAQDYLGLMYERGRGARQDFILAHMWSSIAAATLNGDDGKEALKRRDYVASHMTAAQIEKAQEMARRCQGTKFKECE